MSFSMRLAPFEEYMLADDRGGHPTNFFIRLRFNGALEPERLAVAVEAAIAKHPLLRARAAADERGRWHWIDDLQGGIPLVWNPQMGVADYAQTRPIDLTAEPGLRVLATPGEQRSALLLQFHHACCDGLGAFQFVEDLLVHYAHSPEAPGTATKRSRWDASKLPSRANYGLTPRKLLRMLPRQSVGLLGARQFLMRRPAELKPVLGSNPDARQGLAGEGASNGCASRETRGDAAPVIRPAAMTVEFSPEEAERLRTAARRSGVTVNDLLLRDWFLALDSWRLRRGLGGRKDWIRMTVPVNLRTVADRRTPAANIVSMVFLDRRPFQFDDPEALLQSIHDEMELIRRNELGFTFVFSLHLVRHLPGIFWPMAADPRCRATAGLTNVGPVLRRTKLPRVDGRLVVGPLVLEGVDGLALVRPGTAVCLAVLRYADRLVVTLRWDPEVLTVEHGEELLETFARRVRDSMMAPAVSTKPEAGRSEPECDERSDVQRADCGPF